MVLQRQLWPPDLMPFQTQRTREGRRGGEEGAPASAPAAAPDAAPAQELDGEKPVAVAGDMTPGGTNVKAGGTKAEESACTDGKSSKTRTGKMSPASPNTDRLKGQTDSNLKQMNKYYANKGLISPRRAAKLAASKAAMKGDLAARRAAQEAAKAGSKLSKEEKGGVETSKSSDAHPSA